MVKDPGKKINCGYINASVLDGGIETGEVKEEKSKKENYLNDAWVK